MLEEGGDGQHEIVLFVKCIVNSSATHGKCREDFRRINWNIN